jgi:hypothetical protein
MALLEWYLLRAEHHAAYINVGWLQNNMSTLIWNSMEYVYPPLVDTPYLYLSFVTAPAQDVTEYEPKMWNLTLGQYSPYTASPSPEVDAMWDQIAADGASKLSDFALLDF